MIMIIDHDLDPDIPMSLTMTTVLTLTSSLINCNCWCREKQLLKRELGAELESITDIWRRYLYRGAGGKSPSAGRSAASRSPAPPLTSTPARHTERSYLRFISMV
jgi:hypothetical protein